MIDNRETLTLDQLAKRISTASPEPTVQTLSRLLAEWKTNDHTAEALKAAVDEFINERNEDLEAIHPLWSAFKEKAIHGLGGMTMNERLHWFSLFDRFDAGSEMEKATVYRKLHARP